MTKLWEGGEGVSPDDVRDAVDVVAAARHIDASGLPDDGCLVGAVIIANMLNRLLTTYDGTVIADVVDAVDDKLADLVAALKGSTS